MAQNSNIEWTDHTWNPWRGCSKVNTGCKNCYAETLSKRNPGTLGIWGTEKQGATRVVAAEQTWKEPLRWNKTAVLENYRPRVFLGSLMDWAEDWRGPITRNDMIVVNDLGEWCPAPETGDVGTSTVYMANVRKRMFGVVDQCPNLDFLMLTKRPENIEGFWLGGNGKQRDNVWLGTSVANQETAEQAIPELIKCRDLCKHTFLSVEPLVGPVDFEFKPRIGLREGYTNFALDYIDWVIIGGESGHGARPCNIEWIRDIVRQCKEAGVAVFVKQLGAKPRVDYYEYEDDQYRDFALDNGTVLDGRNLDVWDHQFHGQPAPGSLIELKLKDKKGGDMSEWPEDLRIRDYPNSQVILDSLKS